MNSFITSRMIIPSKEVLYRGVRANPCNWTYQSFFNAYKKRDFDLMKKMMNDGLKVNRRFLFDESFKKNDQQMISLLTTK